MTPCEAIRSRLEELRVDLLPAAERDVRTPPSDVVGDRQEEKFSQVGAPVLSPDGRVVAYSAERYGKEVVVVGDRVGEDCDRVLWGPVFSPDGKKVSYRALKGQELWSKVLDVP
jgi:hypothetical protein